MSGSIGGEDKRTLSGALAIYTAGGLFWAFLPFFVGLQVSSGGLTQAQAGSLGSAYLLGFSLASLSGLWWIKRFGWRRLIATAVLGVIIGLFVLQGAESYLLSILCVLAIGIMMGVLWTIAYRIFSSSSDPERSFAVGIVVSYTFLAIVSYTVGRWIVPGYGLLGSAWLLMGVMLLLGLAGFLIPGGPKRTEAIQVTSASYRPSVSVALSLLGLLGTSMAFAAVWAFAERIGVSVGFSAAQISPIVASNLLASAAGSMLASAVGTRFGRKSTLMAGMALMTLSLLCLLWAQSYLFYAVAIAGLGLTLGFVLPYQMGTVAALDKDSQFVVLIAAAQGLGAAAGPVTGGFGFDMGGTPALVAIAVSAMVLSAILFGSVTVRQE